MLMASCLPALVASGFRGTELDDGSFANLWGVLVKGFNLSYHDRDRYAKNSMVYLLWYFKSNP